jgi:hypothetical protein
MDRFAALLDRLSVTPSRNGKLRLLVAHFTNTPDPDRGLALAALTGSLSFRHAKPATIRELAASRVDPALFALSYDYVGDLAETAALIWPRADTGRALLACTRWSTRCRRRSEQWCRPSSRAGSTRSIPRGAGPSSS